jgi:hypothetical protein
MRHVRSIGQSPMAFGNRVSIDFLRFRFFAPATCCAFSNPLSGSIQCPIFGPVFGLPPALRCVRLSELSESQPRNPGLTKRPHQALSKAETSRSGAIIQAIFSQRRMRRGHGQAPDF